MGRSEELGVGNDVIPASNLFFFLHSKQEKLAGCNRCISAHMPPDQVVWRRIGTDNTE